MEKSHEVAQGAQAGPNKDFKRVWGQLNVMGYVRKEAARELWDTAWNAALATQPAVRVNPEPVALLTVEVRGRITKVDIEWPNGLHTTLPTGKYPLYIVRGAEHE